MSSPLESPPTSANPTPNSPPSGRSAASNVSFVEQARAVVPRTPSEQSTSPIDFRYHDDIEFSPPSLGPKSVPPLPDGAELLSSSVPPSSPSQRVSPLSYADIYYLGLPSEPRLVAGSRTDLRFYSDGAGDPKWEQRSHAPRKRLNAIEASNPLALAWESITPGLISLLDQHYEGVVCVDAVGISENSPNFPDPDRMITVLWIGVPHDALSWQEAMRLVTACDQLLEAHGLAEVDVEIRECCVSYNSAKLRDYTHDLTEEERRFAAIAKPFSTAIGLAITSAEITSGRGTAGLYFEDRQDPESSYALTAQHVLTSERDSECRPSSSSGGRLVSLSLSSDWEAQLDSRVRDCGKEIREDAERQCRPYRRANDWDKALEIVSKADETITRLVEFGEAIKKDWRSEDSRVIGTVFAYPRRDVPDKNGLNFTEDWALIKMHPDKFPRLRENILSLQDSDDMHQANRDRYTLSPKLGDMTDKVVPIIGVLPREEMDSKLAVLKNGATSGVTLGCLNPVRSVFRGSNGVWSQEMCIVGVKGEFSAEGDSGATIIDRSGRFVGLLTSGNGRGIMEPNDSRVCNDLSYATPGWWLLERIAAFGMDLRIVGPAEYAS